jgi:hypothetical protein
VTVSIAVLVPTMNSNGCQNAASELA